MARPENGTSRMAQNQQIRTELRILRILHRVTLRQFFLDASILYVRIAIARHAAAHVHARDMTRRLGAAITYPARCPGQGCGIAGPHWRRERRQSERSGSPAKEFIHAFLVKSRPEFPPAYYECNRHQMNTWWHYCRRSMNSIVNSCIPARGRPSIGVYVGSALA
jgi:hypothetical protein